jgi:hypothetical protein
VRTEEGNLYLFVAIDRTSKFAYADAPMTIPPRSEKRDHPPPPAADHPRGVRPLCYPGNEHSQVETKTEGMSAAVTTATKPGAVRTSLRLRRRSPRRDRRAADRDMQRADRFADVVDIFGAALHMLGAAVVRQRLVNVAQRHLEYVVIHIR